MSKTIPQRIKKSIEEFLLSTTQLLGDRAKKIILYGSYARSDYHNSSDIDIMILTDLTDDEINEYEQKIWDFSFDIELENDVILSPMIRNIETYNIRTTYNPFYKNVQKEGVVLVG